MIAKAETANKDKKLILDLLKVHASTSNELYFDNDSEILDIDRFYAQIQEFYKSQVQKVDLQALYKRYRLSSERDNKSYVW